MAGFMVLQVWREMAVENADGCLYPVSASEENDTPLGEERWFAQYSAPGYMDCTDTVWGETAREALGACWALFGDDQDPSERSEYAACLWEARKLDRKGA